MLYVSGYSVQLNKLINKKDVSTITVKTMDSEVEISNKEDVNNIIDIMSFGQWKTKYIWGLKLKSDICVELNDLVIELYSGEPYAKIILPNSKIRYFKIPSGIVNKIKSYTK